MATSTSLRPEAPCKQQESQRSSALCSQSSSRALLHCHRNLRRRTAVLGGCLQRVGGGCGGRGGSGSSAHAAEDVDVVVGIVGAAPLERDGRSGSNAGGG